MVFQAVCNVVVQISCAYAAKEVNLVGQTVVCRDTVAGGIVRLGCILYEIDHCTALGPCSTCHMTPTSFLVCARLGCILYPAQTLL